LGGTVSASSSDPIKPAFAVTGSSVNIANVTGLVSATNGVAIMGINSLNVNVGPSGTVSGVTAGTGTYGYALACMGNGSSRVELAGGCSIIGDIYLNSTGADVLILSGNVEDTTILASNITADQLNVTGGIWVAAGTFSNNVALTIGSGGTLLCSANETVASLAGEGPLYIFSGHSMTVSGTASTTFSGILSASGVLGGEEQEIENCTFIKDGSGALNLTGVVDRVDLHV
jgi:hypothetical protein